MRRRVFGHEALDDFVRTAGVEDLNSGLAGRRRFRLFFRSAVENGDDAGVSGVLQALEDLQKLVPGGGRTPAVQGRQIRPGENDVVGVDQKEGFGHGGV